MGIVRYTVMAGLMAASFYVGYKFKEHEPVKYNVVVEDRQNFLVNNDSGSKYAIQNDQVGSLKHRLEGVIHDAARDPKSFNRDLRDIGKEMGFER